MSIIRKAGLFNNNSALVFGEQASGKTSTIINNIVEKELNPLWVVFTNADIVSEKHPEWDMAVIGNWEEFDKFYLQISQTPSMIAEYDTIVIEGLDYAATMALTEILARATTNDPRPSYLEMGRTLAARLAGIRGMFHNVYVTLSVIKNKEGNKELAVNEHLYNSINGFFGRKWYTYTEPNKNKKTIKYCVQTDPVLAIRFRSAVNEEITE